MANSDNLLLTELVTLIIIIEALHILSLSKQEVYKLHRPQPSAKSKSFNQHRASFNIVLD